VVKEEKKAIEAQLNMAKKLFKAGEASLTDIHDAEAKYYNVEYRVVDAEKILYTKRKALAIIIGEDPGLLSILVDKPPLENIVPETPEEWIKIAKSENPYLRYYAIQKDLAGDEVRNRGQDWLPLSAFFKLCTNKYSGLSQDEKPLVM